MLAMMRPASVHGLPGLRLRVVKPLAWNPLTGLELSGHMGHAVSYCHIISFHVYRNMSYFYYTVSHHTTSHIHINMYARTRLMSVYIYIYLYVCRELLFLTAWDSAAGWTRASKLRNPVSGCIFLSKDRNCLLQNILA